MRWCFGVAVAAVLAAAFAWHRSSDLTDGVYYAGSSALGRSGDLPDFQGVSGYAARAGERYFLTDRGYLYHATGPELLGVALQGADGEALAEDMRDAEGLALLPDGRFAVSFEGEHRVSLYTQHGVLMSVLHSADAFEHMAGNSGLEALAVSPDGALVAIPERSGAALEPFPVYVYEAGRWRRLSLLRRGAFLPVGADFGPDGRLYVLERDFLLFGFRSRIRRFAWDGVAIKEEETLLKTRFWTHGNLEGIAVFAERGATIIEMVSDNNFLPIQSSELVRYELIAP